MCSASSAASRVAKAGTRRELRSLSDRHHRARRPRPILRVTRRRMNLPVLEDREIKRDRLLRRRIEPKKRRYFLYRGSIMSRRGDSGNAGFFGDLANLACAVDPFVSA